MLNIARYIKLCEQKKNILRVRVRSKSTSHLLTRNNPRSIREHGCGVLFSVTVLAGIVGRIFVALLSATWQAECSMLSWSSGNCSIGTTGSSACSCEAGVVVSTWRTSSALWLRHPAVTERDISRKMDWTSRADCMTSYVSGSNSDGLGTPKDHIYAVPLRTMEEFVVRFQASLTTVDTNMLWSLQDSHAADCPPNWNEKRPLRTHIVTMLQPWFREMFGSNTVRNTVRPD